MARTKVEVRKRHPDYAHILRHEIKATRRFRRTTAATDANLRSMEIELSFLEMGGCRSVV